MGQRWPAAALGARTVAVHTWDLLREVTIIFITSTRVWPLVNSRKGTQLHPATENWIKDLLSIAWGEEMATHSRILAWRIPGTGEPGGLLSMGWPGVGHD